MSTNDRPVTIRIAATEDAALVANIGRFTFYETWRPVNTEEDMQLYLKESFDKEKIKMQLNESQTNLFLLAMLGSEAIGYAKLRRDRTYDEFKGSKVIELERIYVRSEYQQMKIGKQLMDRCIEISKDENNAWLWLGVNDANHKAINFYKQYGFEIFGTKSFQLGTANDTDFLMKLKL
jgi:ribosomal protein S18 acetylase RimI-like enzyme